MNNNAYQRLITPPPSPFASSSFSQHSSSPSFSLSWDDGTSASSVNHDRASTPKPRVPHERFLLIGAVPSDVSDAQLKAAFKTFGDLLGIYVRFLVPNGIVILAFHDSRQCLEAHTRLQANTEPILPNHTDALTSSLLTSASLRNLIGGESSFIADAEASLSVQAEALVNSVILREVLETHGPLCSFQPVDHNGKLFSCEFYDARHARAAMQALDQNSWALGVPLRVMLRPSSSSSGELSFPPTPTTPHYPSLDMEKPVTVEPSSIERERHDTLHLPARPTDAVTSAATKPSRTRRSSTGSAFVPGETTSLGLEKFRASLSGGAPPKSSFKPFDVPTKPIGPTKVKETSAGLLLVDTHSLVPELDSSDDDATPLPPPSTAPTPVTQESPERKMTVALPPFRGPLPLPSPLPAATTLWSGADNVVPFPFQQKDDSDVVVYQSPSTPTSPRHKRALPPRLRSTNIPPLYAPAYQPLLPLSARTSLSHTRDPPSPRNAVELDKIASGRDTRTTLMIKNVPSRMNHDDMERFVNRVCEREYDFLYLRMDFVTGNNVGYAFINFIEVSSLLKFLRAYLGKRWNMYSSDKVMYAAYATYQGKAALVTKFQNSSILDRDQSVQPHIYYSSGEMKGLAEPFPAPNDSARKARSAAAANEYGLYSRMDLQRRQQLSQQQRQHTAYPPPVVYGPPPPARNNNFNNKRSYKKDDWRRGAPSGAPNAPMH